MPAPKPIQVMILGTFHMGGGRDMFNPNVKDMMEARRQAEAEAMANGLAKFKPTKIAIEFPYGRPEPQQWYDHYLSGRRANVKNEFDQVAFRLGKKAGVKEVYGVDWKKDMDIQGLLDHASQIGQKDVADAMMARFQKEIVPRLSDEKWEQQTLTQIYRSMNTPEEDQVGHSIYMDMTKVGKGDDYMGADLVAGWYERNLKIATNIARIAKPGDRIFVLMGAGHAKLLREYLGQMDGFAAVWPNKYLKGE